MLMKFGIVTSSSGKATKKLYESLRMIRSLKKKLLILLGIMSGMKTKKQNILTLMRMKEPLYSMFIKRMGGFLRKKSLIQKIRQTEFSLI